MYQGAALFLSCLAFAIAYQLFRWLSQARLQLEAQAVLSAELEEQRIRTYSFSIQAGQAEAENDRLAGQLAQLKAELERVAQKRHTQKTTEMIEDGTGAVLDLLDAVQYVEHRAHTLHAILTAGRPGPDAYKPPALTHNRPARPGAAAVKPWHL